MWFLLKPKLQDTLKPTLRGGKCNCHPHLRTITLSSDRPHFCKDDLICAVSFHPVNLNINGPSQSMTVCSSLKPLAPPNLCSIWAITPLFVLATHPPTQHDAVAGGNVLERHAHCQLAAQLLEQHLQPSMMNGIEG